MLLRVKLVRCALSVHALIPIAAPTYQLSAGALRRAPGRAALPPAAHTAPHRRLHGGAFVPPGARSGGFALTHLRQALIPGRGSPARRDRESGIGTAPCPGRATGTEPARPPAGPRPGGERGKLRGGPSSVLVQVAASPRFGLGVGDRGGGDTESRALRAMGSRSRAGRRGASIPSLREHSSRARSEAAGERQEKLPPVKGSHQIASRLGAPLKAQSRSPKLLVAGCKSGVLVESWTLGQPSEWTARADSNTLR